MRKLYEIVLVIAAAGLAATVVLIEIPSGSGDPGRVVAGGSLLDALPPRSASTPTPLPPFAFPAAASTPAPVEPLTTPAPAQELDVRPSGSVAGSTFFATGRLGASSAQRLHTSPSREAAASKKPHPPSAARSKATPQVKKHTPPPAAKSKATPESRKSKPASKPKPLHPGKKKSLSGQLETPKATSGG